MFLQLSPLFLIGDVLESPVVVAEAASIALERRRFIWLTIV